MRTRTLTLVLAAATLPLLGAGLYGAAHSVDTSPDPQVVLTGSRVADDSPSTSDVSTPVSTPVTAAVEDDRPGTTTAPPVSSLTRTTVDDHGGDRVGTDDSVTQTTVDDSTTSSTSPTSSTPPATSVTQTTIDDHGGDRVGSDDPVTQTTIDDHGGDRVGSDDSGSGSGGSDDG